MEQYRILFTINTINGKETRSTKWYNTIEEVNNSRWLNENDAKIDTRIYVKTTFKQR